MTVSSNPGALLGSGVGTSVGRRLRKPKLIGTTPDPAKAAPVAQAVGAGVGGYAGASRVGTPPTATTATAPTGTTPVSSNPAPPQTVAGQQLRINADQAYTGSVSNANQALYNAALRYGDTGLLGRPEFADSLNGVDPNSIDLSGSDLGTIARNRVNEQLTNDETHNAAGTYWSGFHGKDARDLNQNEDRNAEQALQTYLAASQAWSQALGGATGTKNDAYANADINDENAALALDPQATGIVKTPLQKQVAAATRGGAGVGAFGNIVARPTDTSRASSVGSGVGAHAKKKPKRKKN